MIKQPNLSFLNFKKYFLNELYKKFVIFNYLMHTSNIKIINFFFYKNILFIGYFVYHFIAENVKLILNYYLNMNF